MKTIDDFGNKSGFFLNAGKTRAIWLGNKRNSPVKLMPNLQMEWNPASFTIIGIWFTNSLKDCEEINLRCINQSAVQSMDDTTNSSSWQVCHPEVIYFVKKY